MCGIWSQLSSNKLHDIKIYSIFDSTSLAVRFEWDEQILLPISRARSNINTDCTEIQLDPSSYSIHLWYCRIFAIRNFNIPFWQQRLFIAVSVLMLIAVYCLSLGKFERMQISKPWQTFPKVFAVFFSSNFQTIHEFT